MIAQLDSQLLRTHSQLEHEQKSSGRLEKDLLSMGEKM